MKLFFNFLLSLFFCVTVFAQTHITPPSTCVTAEFLLDVNSQGLFLCTSPNTWTYLPISTLVYTLVNVPNGVAGLDSTGHVPSVYLPSTSVGSAAFSALSGVPSDNAALAAVLNTFVTGPSSSTAGHMACYSSASGHTLEDCGAPSSGGSATFPYTPGVAGEYALIAIDPGTATNSFSAVKVNPLPSCSSMASGVVSGPCITTAGLGSYFQYVDHETSNFTLPGTDVGALVAINGASTVALPQCGVGLYIAGTSVDLVNYSGSTAVTVSATSSTIGAGSTSRNISATTGSSSSIVYHGFTAVCNAAGNYDVKNVY